jgi:predicted ATPase
VRWTPKSDGSIEQGKQADGVESLSLPEIANVKIYALDAQRICQQAPVRSDLALKDDGFGLVAVLDRLRDRVGERWEALEEELPKWFPEFDRVLLDSPKEGQKVFSLRRKTDGAEIPGNLLSQGTLIALAILTIAHLPDAPMLVGFEEPDRGLHPRMLQQVQQAIYYRLAYPEQFGESRKPVQVIATTHSPYLLDLFEADEVVVCEKLDDNFRFTRLSDMPNVSDILEGASLGDVWYSGALGGVPAVP